MGKKNNQIIFEINPLKVVCLVFCVCLVFGLGFFLGVIIRIQKE